MKRLILGMSKPRAVVGAKIEQGTRQMIFHLIKIWGHPESDCISGWRQEVADKLDLVDSFKGSHKYPSKKFILDNSWNLHRERLPKYVEFVRDDYDKLGEIDIDELRSAIDAYFDWLATNLSEDGQVSHKRIYEKLKSLGF